MFRMRTIRMGVRQHTKGNATGSATRGLPRRPLSGEGLPPRTHTRDYLGRGAFACFRARREPGRFRGPLFSSVSSPDRLESAETVQCRVPKRPAAGAQAERDQ